MQNIEERLLTRSDLQQFLETVLAAVRDHLQSPCAFVAALDGDELSLSVVAGNRAILEKENLDEALKVLEHNGENGRHEFVWGDFWILPLRQRRIAAKAVPREWQSVSDARRRPLKATPTSRSPIPPGGAAFLGTVPSSAVASGRSFRSRAGR